MVSPLGEESVDAAAIGEVEHYVEVFDFGEQGSDEDFDGRIQHGGGVCRLNHHTEHGRAGLDPVAGFRQRPAEPSAVDPGGGLAERLDKQAVRIHAALEVALVQRRIGGEGAVGRSADVERLALLDPEFDAGGNGSAYDFKKSCHSIQSIAAGILLVWEQWNGCEG
jgi:hypothetical protein